MLRNSVNSSANMTGTSSQLPKPPLAKKNAHLQANQVLDSVAPLSNEALLKLADENIASIDKQLVAQQQHVPALIDPS